MKIDLKLNPIHKNLCNLWKQSEDRSKAALIGRMNQLAHDPKIIVGLTEGEDKTMGKN